MKLNRTELYALRNALWWAQLNCKEAGSKALSQWSELHEKIEHEARRKSNIPAIVATLRKKYAERRPE
jgi:hypothetical protein